MFTDLSPEDRFLYLTIVTKNSEGKYDVLLLADHVMFTLGTSDTEQEAAKFRKAAARILSSVFGELSDDMYRVMKGLWKTCTTELVSPPELDSNDRLYSPKTWRKDSVDWCHLCGERDMASFVEFSVPKNAEHSVEDAGRGTFRFCHKCIGTLSSAVYRKIS